MSLEDSRPIHWTIGPKNPAHEEQGGYVACLRTSLTHLPVTQFVMPSPISRARLYDSPSSRTQDGATFYIHHTFSALKGVRSRDPIRNRTWILSLGGCYTILCAIGPEGSVALSAAANMTTRYMWFTMWKRTWLRISTFTQVTWAKTAGLRTVIHISSLCCLLRWPRKNRTFHFQVISLAV